MTRENKAGLLVSASFLALVGTVVTLKMRAIDGTRTERAVVTGFEHGLWRKQSRWRKTIAPSGERAFS